MTARAIPGGQHELVERDLALYDVQPRSAFGRELVNDVLSGIEQGRVHPGILLEVPRSSPCVGRGDDAEFASALRRAEALLLSPVLALGRRAAQPGILA